MKTITTQVTKPEILYSFFNGNLLFLKQHLLTTICELIKLIKCLHNLATMPNIAGIEHALMGMLKNRLSIFKRVTCGRNGRGTPCKQV